jgi:geranylgeranyl pyrophosphate synthase
VTEALVLETYLEEARAEVEAGLAEVLAELEGFLPPALTPAVRQGVTTGGKRLRPILCIAAWEACRPAAGTPRAPATGSAPAPAALRQPLVHLACSLELIHAYSLMHDDLPSMDNAPLRRGLPTPHVTHGVPATLLAGAALIPLAGLVAWRAGRALGLTDDEVRGLLRVLARAAGGEGMVGGQGLDLEGEGKRLDRAALDRLHRGKTGALLRASLEMGALAARAAPEARGALERYGAAIGLAFQIADDILDATADEVALGKRPSDAALDKSTYVALLGVDGAVREAQSIVNQALESLDRGGVDAPPLRALARYVVERDR